MTAQDSSRTKNVICITPTKANKANGLIIGLWNRPDHVQQKFNGLNIELLGSGWMTLFLGMDDGGYVRNQNQTINGISFGLTILNGNMNGLSISPSFNTTIYFSGLKLGLFNFDLHRSNGIQIGLTNDNEENAGIVIGVYNKAVVTKGLQIGFINKSDELHGLQVGLININDSRTLPFINWRTKRKK